MTLLRALADYAITTHFPHLGPPSHETYVRFFAEVCALTAVTIVDWMRVGFVHGVMNTDNMSILGLTIDYGPYGWLEGYEPGWTPNTTDAHGRRYAFGNQPSIAWWNLLRFGDALVPLVGDGAPLQDSLEGFGEKLSVALREMLAGKIGVRDTVGDPADERLIEDLLDVLVLTETDMTLFYRGLAQVPSAADATDEELLAPLAAAYYTPAELHAAHRETTLGWLRRYTARLREDAVRHKDTARQQDAAGQQDGAQDHADAQRKVRMNAINPKFVMRNYLAQLAIDDAERGDGGKVAELLE